METHGPDRSSVDSEVDFTAITGVGAKTSTALNEAGVHSMEALAAMSVGQVSAALEGVGIQISAGKIISQLWLQQAWMLSTLSDQPATKAGEAMTPVGVEAAEVTDQPADNVNDWQEQFGVFVYLDRSEDGRRWRTRIWDTTEMVEEQLPGVAPGLLVDLIIDRVEASKGG